MSISFSTLSLEQKRRRQSISTSPCIQPSEIMFLFRREIKRPRNTAEIAKRKVTGGPESLTSSLHITLQGLFLFQPSSTKCPVCDAHHKHLSGLWISDWILYGKTGFSLRNFMLQTITLCPSQCSIEDSVKIQYFKWQGIIMSRSVVKLEIAFCKASLRQFPVREEVEHFGRIALSIKAEST